MMPTVTSQPEVPDSQQECIDEDQWALRVQIHKESFEAGMAKSREAKGGNHTTSLSELKYKSLVLQLYEWDTSSSAERTRRRQDHGTIVYKNARKYCVVEVDEGNLKLHFKESEEKCSRKGKKKSGSEKVFVGKPVMHDGMKFDALTALHGSDAVAGHAKGKTLRAMVIAEYGNSITQKEQELFYSLCPGCIRHLPKLKTGPAGARPIVTKNLGGRGLIDIVELQAHAADNFGYK